MTRMIDLAGKRFGNFSVLGKAAKRGKSNAAIWICKCDCGTTETRDGVALRSGKATKCRQCIYKGYETHGLSGTRILICWKSMNDRCNLPSRHNYASYGGKGIKVCKRWKSSVLMFLEDMGHPPEGKSIDRIDNDGDYTPENCRWATPKEQRRNTSRNRNYTYEGETKCMKDWAIEYSIPTVTLWSRLGRGLTIEQALFFKAGKHNTT